MHVPSRNLWTVTGVFLLVALWLQLCCQCETTTKESSPTSKVHGDLRRMTGVLNPATDSVKSSDILNQHDNFLENFSSFWDDDELPFTVTRPHPENPCWLELQFRNQIVQDQTKITVKVPTRQLILQYAHFEETFSEEATNIVKLSDKCVLDFTKEDNASGFAMKDEEGSSGGTKAVRIWFPLKQSKVSEVEEEALDEPKEDNTKPAAAAAQQQPQPLEAALRRYEWSDEF